MRISHVLLVLILNAVLAISSVSAKDSLPLAPCYDPRDPKKPVVEVKSVQGSELLAVTPKNYEEYKNSIVTLGEKFVASETEPLKSGKRYQVSAKLPKFMLLRTNQDGVHEMRGFGADIRYFLRRSVNGKTVWIGVPKPKTESWLGDIDLTPVVKLPRVDYSKMDRADLIEQISTNVGEASKTVQDTQAKPNPARAQAAALGLRNAAELILKKIDLKQGFTIEGLEELHAVVANGTIETRNGDLGLGIHRGSEPRCIKSGGKYLLVDMTKTSVRMGEQMVMSYTAPEDVKDALQVLLDRINLVNPKTQPDEVAQIYTQFIAIHPFIDGNGRTSRMLLQYMQLKMQVPLSKLDDKAAFQAFYLKPTELTNLIFHPGIAAAGNGVRENAQP